MLYFVVLLLHILVCIFLIIVVLLQSGKAADLAGAFGGMGSQTAFGPRGSATLLSKATTVSAVIFMLTSLSLSILATKRAGFSSTVLETGPRTSAPAQQNRPAQPPAGSPGAPSGGETTVPLNIPPPPAQSAPGQPAPAQPVTPQQAPAPKR